MRSILFFLFLSAIHSCTFKDDRFNEYFNQIDQQSTSLINQPKEIIKLSDKELEKYKKTGKKEYLISSKYTKMYLFRDTNLKQVPLAYEILKLNNDEYEFISMSCNFNLAFQFENSSPKLAMQFIDQAIHWNDKLKITKYTPHLYHIKGRFYYNQENYDKALYYFDKSLKSLLPDEQYFIASMYNNFGLTYDQLNKNDLAILKTQKGIEILESKNNLRPDEITFLTHMKGNFGFYYYKNGDFLTAEKLLLQEFNYYKEKKLYSNSIMTSERLFDIYAAIKQTDKEKEVIDYLVGIEPQLQKTHEKINVNEVIQKYYSRHHDFNNLQKISEKLILLNHASDDENHRNLKQTSDILNNYMLKTINEKSDYEINSQKKRNTFLMILIVLSVTIFMIMIIYTRKNTLKEKEIAENQKLILEKNEEILKQNIEFQEERIKNLQQNLHLKMETEKVFFENIKQIKKVKNIDIEKTLNDLFFKISNLIEIDKKNYDLMTESYGENDQFIQKLSNGFPFLTKKELKLCIYFRMNLSSKEIASLDNTTMGTIRVYKAKIKSKIGLKKNENLTDFLNNI
ncbi:tetratricopeptide repeat protein [Chryseobacterium vrystaatense]|uniref:Uncharacterized protein n=1 Tax=Chryseobacterium vrystaatense TaxID=307480 RepID=A0A1M5DYI8_9FLAO|nr:tetratricopeptide repeat protein [Chryseobacterium vrystaatense]SHF72088.1 hypothetical protein SAMN02787073_2757 [Chryseobacterium vrystaatense]